MAPLSRWAGSADGRGAGGEGSEREIDHGHRRQAEPSGSSPCIRPRRGAGGIPDPRPPGQRPLARLPRQRGEHPEAAGGHRGPHPLLRGVLRQRRARGAHPVDERHRGPRAGAPDGAALPRGGAAGGGSLPPRHHRGDQPRGLELGADECRSGRRGPRHRARAPLEHRPLADALRRARGDAQGRADR